MAELLRRNGRSAEMAELLLQLCEKLHTEATNALKVKGRADASHAKEVKGERPPFILSFSPVISTISAHRIQQRISCWCGAVISIL
jgi:hypothetical protein